MLRAALVLTLLFIIAPAWAQDAATLRERHATLRAQLADNAFGRPLHVESSAQRGDIYAVVEQPFAHVAQALAQPQQWCDVLLLQVNIKRCDAGGQSLSAFVTRRPRDTVDNAHRFEFRFTPSAMDAGYFRSELDAAAGPMGTRDYRIALEATPLDERRTFLHLSYSYTLGWAARLAMDAYLAGSGRGKPGFSVAGGERGVTERGAMRHYLAIEAYLHSQDDLEARLRRWYAAIERYPQLREPVDADEYFAMKRGG